MFRLHGVAHFCYDAKSVLSPSGAGGSRVSDIDPTEVTFAGRRPLSEKFGQDGTEMPAPPALVKPEREGLPPGYRMRADAHYVEQLTSRRIERPDPRAAGADHGETDAQPDGRDRRQERLLAQVGEEVAAIGAAVNLLTGEGAGPARRLSLDLIRAQAWRASWLLRAHALLEGTARPLPRPRAVGPLLEQIRLGLAPECRLAGVTLRVLASDWNAVVTVDEAIIVAGVTGAVMAQLGLLGQIEGATLTIAADATGADLRAIDVTQDDVQAGPSMGQRVFDPSWIDRPGGFVAAIGALSARAAAQQHGGTAALLASDRRGTTLRLGLTRTH
jgi:hypothetical protein